MHAIAPFSRYLLYRIDFRLVKEVHRIVDTKKQPVLMNRLRVGSTELEFTLFKDKTIFLELDEVFVVDDFLHE